MRRRVVVVGAGLAGLSAAAIAAREGAEVTLLDARDSLGGRARTQAVDGFLLNQGAHTLYRGGPGWKVLTGLGIEPERREAERRRVFGDPGRRTVRHASGFGVVVGPLTVGQRTGEARDRAGPGPAAAA